MSVEDGRGVDGVEQHARDMTDTDCVGRLNSIWQQMRPLLDQRYRHMLKVTLHEIQDSEAPQWGSKESWNSWLDDLETAAHSARDQLPKVVRDGYLRVQFYRNHRNDPPLGSKEDQEQLVAYTADELRRRLANS